jgi:hypothetical protein
MWMLSDFIALVDNDGSSDWRIWLLEIGGALSLFGLAGSALWNLQYAWRDARGGFAKMWSTLVLLSSLSLLWLMVAFHLLSFGTHY